MRDRWNDIESRSSSHSGPAGVGLAAALLAMLVWSLVACVGGEAPVGSDTDLREPPAGPYLVVLGVAQDGGVPQAGSDFDPAWEDDSQRRRVVSIGLVDPRQGRRYLFEATPDLRDQLHSLWQWAPPPTGQRVLDGVFLTHAHMGHYTGLMFLGFESLGARSIPVYAMPRMAAYLESNGPWDQLVRFENIEIENLEDARPVSLAEDLTVTPFLVPHRQEYSEVVGFRIDGPRRSVLFIPDIDSWEVWEQQGVRIEDLLADVDLALVDGSFWDHGEIPGRDMSGFPHPLIAESLERFAALPEEERRKIRFIHFNHTNPVLRRDGAERDAVEAAGASIAVEGEVIEL